MDIVMPETSKCMFQEGMAALYKSGTPFLIGGAFAVYHYSGMWRNTNDLDLYIDRRYIEQAVSILDEEGFLDQGEMAAGDREWIHHAVKNGVMIDLIWGSPNHISTVTGDHYERAPTGTFLDIPVRFLPADELLRAKIFTISRHRCDWPDIVAVVKAHPATLDWGRLLNRMGDRWSLLLSFIIMMEWAYPVEASEIPESMKKDLMERKYHLPPSKTHPSQEALLDPWIYTRPLSP